MYDYITNEPRQYANELLFKPIDKLVKPAKIMLDLGCGTGQMFLRFSSKVSQIVAVDHSQEMLAVAEEKARKEGVRHVNFVNQDIEEFLNINPSLRVDLITCVGVLHHLNQDGLNHLLKKLTAILNDSGQLLIAEPIYSTSVPKIVEARNQKSILIPRLAECMPSETSDPDEAPLHEYALKEAVKRSGLCTQKISKGFELFQMTYPVSIIEKLIIQAIYKRWRSVGDVIAILLEKQTGAKSNSSSESR